MRENETVRCPACGETSVAKRRKVFEGFRAVGEELACALCGAKLAATAQADAVPSGSAATSRKLAALLGSDQAPAAPTLRDAGEAPHFCRDCAHYLKHPFHTRCNLKNQDVNPMGDCPEWNALKPQEG